MTQTLSVPNNRAVKLIAEQSTGAETALLVDAAGHLQIDAVTAAVTDAAGNLLLGTIDADTGAISTATQKVAAEVGVGTGLLVRQGVMGALTTEKQYAYSHLAADGVVKGAAGFIHSISINTPATASVISIFNDPAAATPGAEVAVITRNVGDLVGETKILDVLCPLGIYVDMSVNVDVTVSYR
jgi:hypothetical protein